MQQQTIQACRRCHELGHEEGSCTASNSDLKDKGLLLTCKSCGLEKHVCGHEYSTDCQAFSIETRVLAELFLMAVHLAAAHPELPAIKQACLKKSSEARVRFQVANQQSTAMRRPLAQLQSQRYPNKR